MSPRVLVATGDESLDTAIAARLDVVACERYPGAVLAATRREYPDAAVVGASLAGEETAELVQVLLDEGVRVLWLIGERQPPPWAGAVDALDMVRGPSEAGEILRRLAGRSGPTAQVAETKPAYAEAEAAGRDRWGPGATGHPDVGAGLTAFLGALPGCGTSRAAIALAREHAAFGRDVLLVDAHAERAHLAHLLLGRHLDLLDPEDRARSWRHARGAEGLRRCAVQVSPGLRLLALAFDPDPGGPIPTVTASPDLAVRFSREVATVDVVCRREYVPQDAVTVLAALAETGRTVRVRAVADGFADADRRMWSEGLGAFVADAAVKPAGAAVQLVAELTRALRICSTVAPVAVVDLGAPRPLVGGVTDPRVSWAAQHARVVVVTRSDPIGAEAAERMLTTLRCEAERAGLELRAEVLDAEKGVRRPAPLPA